MINTFHTLVILPPALPLIVRAIADALTQVRALVVVKRKTYNFFVEKEKNKKKYKICLP